jgi:hypothetical protein
MHHIHVEAGGLLPTHVRRRNDGAGPPLDTAIADCRAFTKRRPRTPTTIHADLAALLRVTLGRLRFWIFWTINFLALWILSDLTMAIPLTAAA